MTTACAAGTSPPEWRVRLDRAEVLRLLGMGRGQPPEGPVARVVDLMMEEGASLLEPRVAWRRARVLRIEPGRVVVEGNAAFRTRRLVQALEGADEVVCFVATIGPALEDQVARLSSEGLWAEACVLDAVGSAAAEALAEEVYRDLGNELARRGRGTTLRFSPGYCDWPVEGQFDLFRVLGPDAAGVHLLDSGFMVPRKSVSAVFGVLAPGTAGRGPGAANPCAECAMEACPMRRSA